MINTPILITMEIDDLIGEGVSTVDIAAFQKFKTSLKYNAEITDITICDINQDIDGTSIVTMFEADITVDGDVYRVIFSLFDDDEMLTSIVTFNQRREQKVRDFIRHFCC